LTCHRSRVLIAIGRHLGSSRWNERSTNSQGIIPAPAIHKDRWCTSFHNKHQSPEVCGGHRICLPASVSAGRTLGLASRTSALRPRGRTASLEVRLLVILITKSARGLPTIQSSASKCSNCKAARDSWKEVLPMTPAAPRSGDLHGAMATPDMGGAKGCAGAGVALNRQLDAQYRRTSKEMM
jgi:hypothetical protein